RRRRCGRTVARSVAAGTPCVPSARSRLHRAVELHPRRARSGFPRALSGVRDDARGGPARSTLRNVLGGPPAPRRAGLPRVPRPRSPPAPPAPRIVRTCAVCAASPPPYDYARSAALYADELRDALHALKFAGRRALAAPLGDLAAEQCGATLPNGIDAVIPVP